MRFEKLLLIVWALTGCSDGVRGDLLRVVKDGGGHASTPTAKLIEVGHYPPTGTTGIDALIRNASMADDRPFDGLVVDIGFDHHVFTSTPLIRSDFESAVAALERLPLQRVTENFQSLGVDPGDVDWFDDPSFAQVVLNTGLAAAMVRDAGLRGFFIDTQPYVTPIWAYLHNPPGKTFEAYQAQVAKRGREVASGIFDADPEIVLILNLAYSELFRSVCLSGKALDAEPYGLLPSFLDGLMQEATLRGAQGQIVDGFIGSYPTRDAASFELFYRLIHYDWDAIVANWKPNVISHRYPEGIVQWSVVPNRTCDDRILAQLARDQPASFGVMMDYDAEQRGGFALDPAGISRNYFSPDDLARTIRGALLRSDRYVWIWSESVDWWATSTLPKAPDAYLEALRVARGSVAP